MSYEKCLRGCSTKQESCLVKIGLQAVFLYQSIVSPWLGQQCRFFPSCSEYASEAIKQHGFFRGLLMVLSRLLRCHPFHSGGYDPVYK